MLILGFLAADAVVGSYSAAYRVVYAILTINVLMGAALLPLKSRARDREPAAYGAMIGRLSYATAAAMLPVALGITLLAGPIVRLLFGAEFAGAALPLSILSWSLLILPMGENLRRVLWAFDVAARDVRALAVSAGVLLLACAALVPRFGAAGTAVATLLAETTLLAISIAEVRRLVAPFPLVKPVRPLVVSALAMVAAVWPARSLGLAAAVPIGAVVYIGALALQRGIPSEILPRWSRRG
jgi:O-antigen/teichoic acid export membrane protein